jgi:hypothetical protein
MPEYLQMGIKDLLNNQVFRSMLSDSDSAKTWLAWTWQLGKDLAQTWQRLGKEKKNLKYGKFYSQKILMTFPIHISYKTTVYAEIHKIISLNVITKHLTLNICIQNSELKDNSIIKFTKILLNSTT